MSSPDRSSFKCLLRARSLISAFELVGVQPAHKPGRKAGLQLVLRSESRTAESAWRDQCFGHDKDGCLFESVDVDYTAL